MTNRGHVMVENSGDQADQEPASAAASSEPTRRSTAGASAIQASPARVHNFWLGGKDNYQIDREVGATVMRRAPWIAAGARAGRAFLVDAVRRLAEAGVTQFLDVGAGLPASPNVHEVARGVTDDYRVVYVDNDPLVLSPARALLEADGREPGRNGPVEGVHVLDGNLYRPGQLWRDLEVERWLDLDRPVALLLTGVLQFVPDDVTARQIVAALADRLPPGSHVVISHPYAADDRRGRATRAAAAQYTSRVAPFQVRTRAQVESLFVVGDLIDPGLRELSYRSRPTAVLAGVAVKR